MGLLLNRRREMGGGEVLPYDAQIEYLDGYCAEQFINTNYKFSSNKVSIKMKLNIYNNTTFNRVFGSDGSGSYGIQVAVRSTNVMNIPIGNSDKNISSCPFQTDVELELIANNGSLTVNVNGATTTSTYNGSVVNNGDLCIFRNGNTAYTSTNRIKLYYFQVWDNDSLVRNMIPVRVGQVGYLYDKVSKALFSNAGSGSFTLGPDA